MVIKGVRGRDLGYTSRSSFELIFLNSSLFVFYRLYSLCCVMVLTQECIFFCLLFYIGCLVETYPQKDIRINYRHLVSLDIHINCRL